MRGELRKTLVAGACLGLSLGLAACGGGERQDADEDAGTYKVEVLNAAFPKDQHLAKQATMRITVRNADSKALPNVAVTVRGFYKPSEQPGLADPERPVWIVDEGPKGGDTAYVGTWSFSDLPPGESKTFEWKVTPVKPGLQTTTYRVAAGLDGKAKAELESGGVPEGSFKVNVDGKPAETIVDDDGNVVRVGEEPTE
jgi:hypothetical protein